MTEAIRVPRRVPFPYYESDAHATPSWGSDYVLEWECPPREFDNLSSGCVDFEPGPRTRVVLEGRTELVQEIMAAAHVKMLEVDARLREERARA